MSQGLRDGMSRFLFNQAVIQSLGTNNATGAAVLLTPVLELWPFYYLSAEVKWTGNPTGTITWEASNQYHPITNPGATFIQIDNAFVQRIGGVNNPAGSANSYMANVNLFGSQTVAALGARWVRMRYVNSGGAGPLDAWFSAEGYD
jgi:P pilus assembly chaperone PapD